MQLFSSKSSGVNFTPYVLALILLTGFSFRLLYNEGTFIDNPIRGDAAYYFVYAQNIIEHGTFSKDYKSIPPTPDSFWAPGYPTFLAAVILAADALNLDTYSTLQTIQAVLGALTIWLTYYLAILFMSRNAALFASGLVALSPHLISMGSYALTETLTCFLLLLALTLASWGVTQGRRVLLVLSGISFGLAYLVNPVVIICAPVTAWVLLRHNANAVDHPRSRAHTVKATAALLLPILIIAGAWSLRNAVNVEAGGQSASSRLIGNLIIGLNPDFHDIWRNNPRDPNNPTTLDASIIGGSYTKFFSVAGERVAREPVTYLKWYLIDKPLLLWDWSIRIGQGDVFVYPVIYSLFHTSKFALAVHSIMKSLHPWLFATAVLAIFALWRTRNSTSNRIGMVVYMNTVVISSVYVITQAEPRYSIPLRPEMYLCATLTLWQIAEYVRGQFGKDQTGSGTKEEPDYSPSR